MRKHAFTKLLAAALCIISIGALYPLPSHAAFNGTITDSFDGPALNTGLWTLYHDPQTQVVQQGGELRITKAAGKEACVQVEPKFRLKGDFEATLDYRLITWPEANGGRLGFEGPGFSGADYAMCMVKRISHDAQEQPNPGEEVFSAAFKEGPAWSAFEMLTDNIAGEYGTLKLVRAGNQMVGYFSKNGGP